MTIRVDGITHVAIELSSPTRMERYLRDVFGLQLLRQGYLHGEYVRIIGSPHTQRRNPGFLILYNRPFIARGRLRHIGFAVREGIDAAVIDLRRRGYEVDGEDIVTAPWDLKIKLDSFTNPRPLPVHDPSTKMVDAPVDVNLPCLWRGIHHVSPDVPAHGPVLDWLMVAFSMDLRKDAVDRRGELVTSVKYSDGTKDSIGRLPPILTQFQRTGTSRVELNHIAFETPDAEGAIDALEGRGVQVDLPGDALVYGPEEVWFQIESRDTPFPVDHKANQVGVTFIPYKVG
jgi:catechol 2,3-dioxygenase-like lactoylglutathione lyase family enzyme